MKKIYWSSLLALTILTLAVPAQDAGPGAKSSALKDSRLFEMRTYYAAEGKLDALNARFRDHTVKLFEKHGITNIGYWIPMENPENTLIYLLAFPSREAREKSWKEFGADPEWKEVVKTSEANGRLVTKVVSVSMQATDYSPAIKVGAASPARVFELRTYKCTTGNLPNLNARFRDHTLGLFAKHGLTSIGYWTPLDQKQGSDDTLIYMLAHQSRESAAESWKNFRADPAWVEARKASETKAGGSLTQTNGVQSVFLTPMDYSPIK